MVLLLTLADFFAEGETLIWLLQRNFIFEQYTPIGKSVFSVPILDLATTLKLRF